MPHVSVIIPNYNHARYLVQRIDSVLGQTFTDLEVIILDDKSTDNSREVISSYTDARITQTIFNDTNSGGPFGQWEKGITAATGKWIWIAESDDYASPAFLEMLLKLATEHSDAGIVFSGSHWVDDKGVAGADLSVHRQSFYGTGPAEIRKHMAWQCSIQNASSAIIRRDLAADAIKGLAHYRACGDWVFYTRILQKAALVHTAQKLNYFRWYHNNISNSAKNNGAWLTEGIKVLDNINTNRVKFTLLEFLKIAKFWAGTIRRATGDHKKERAVLMDFIKRYFKLKTTQPI